MSGAHISDFPNVLDFLRHYWWETADLVYGEEGIKAAIRQYLCDHSQSDGYQFRIPLLAAELERLEATEFAGEPNWGSTDYFDFWSHSDVSRVLTGSDIASMRYEMRG